VLRRPGRSVVLIDEIDKADIDFPNDLLRELEEKTFIIEELDESQLTKEDRRQGFRRTYRAQEPPIVVITSNDEKELPDAFLRRCVFHYIEFPSRQRLVEIVRVNTKGLDLDERLVELAVDRFRELSGLEDFRKTPATSELIDWVKILHYWGVQSDDLAGRSDLTRLPDWRVLFKHQQDVTAVERHAPTEPETAP